MPRRWLIHSLGMSSANPGTSGKSTTQLRKTRPGRKDAVVGDPIDHDAKDFVAPDPLYLA